MKKTHFYSIVAITLIAVAFMIGYGYKNTSLGSSVEGSWKKLTTGHDQAVSYGPAILKTITVGTANDEVVIGDVLYSATASTSDQYVYDITATTPMTFEVDTIFTQGIMANVTSTNGVVFTISPQ